LEKFFDTVNHDKLMTLIGRTIKDGDVISIIRKFLVSGIMVDNEYKESVIGTPQGGTISPLLANIMLNELDKEMEQRGLDFVRYVKVEKLNELIRGWINYFKIGSMKTLCAKMDSNIRYRLRMCIWKHWKTPQNRAKNLMKPGINKYTAWKVAYAGERIAYACNKGAVNIAISNKRLASFGLISMLDYYTKRCVTC
jgi:predicted XRE-type DNA-binding protein